MSLHPGTRPRRAPRALLATIVVVLAGILSACRATVEVRLDVARDGSGSVTVTVTADAEIVEQAPSLADDLRTDDLVAAGWTVDGPAPTDDGGLILSISKPFTGATEANAVLAELSGPNGPFQALELTQEFAPQRISTSLRGQVLISSPDAFSDAGLSASLGGAPYEALLDERRLSLDDALDLSLVASLPGEIDETDGTAAPYDETGERTEIRWDAALSGAAATPPGQSILARAAFADEGAGRAARVRDFALWAIPAWLTFFVLVILPVVYLRRRRRA